MLHAVRVLNCAGSGSIAGVIAGVDWVANNKAAPRRGQHESGWQQEHALDEAVAKAVASGVTFVVAAGNESQDACYHSPAASPTAITVGATTEDDKRASFSNWGSCVDVFAPGDKITSAWINDDAATRSSVAPPWPRRTSRVLAALFLERNPSATPAAVTSALVDNATPGKVGRCWASARPTG